MRPSAILSVTALPFSSFATALPTADSPALAPRDAIQESHVTAIESRGLNRADLATYRKMKDLQAQTIQYETRAHDTMVRLIHLKPKDAGLKPSY
jgi:hypothetical protein